MFILIRNSKIFNLNLKLLQQKHNIINQYLVNSILTIKI